MKKMTKQHLRLISAVLLLALLCVSGCTDSDPIRVDDDSYYYEDNLFSYFMKYDEYDDNESLNTAMSLAKIQGDIWYGDSYPEIDDDLEWLFDYTISAHTSDGRGVFVYDIPSSAGMSQIDFVLLTTQDYGRTWTPSGGIYHVVGGVSQITINEDYVYVIISSSTLYGESCVLVSEDFGQTFKAYTVDNLIPGKYLARFYELYGVYMRIINVESDGEIILECYCDGYIGDMSSDELQEYENSFKSDGETAIMILSLDKDLSKVKTLYADDSFFN